jgi:HlyD family secretion protein
MKNWRARWQWIAGSVVLAVMGVSAFRLVRAFPATTPRAEDVAKGTRTAAPLGGASDEQATKAPPGTVSGSGVVEPRDRQTNVSAPVAGRIAAVAAREGQRVNAGDVLVELEGSVERAALAAATADFAAAHAQLLRVVRGNRAEETQAAVAEADAASARAEQSKGEADRLSALLARGSVAAAEAERAVLGAQAARSAAAAAAARAHALLSGSRREDVQLAHAQADAAEARRDQAQAALDRLLVRAPTAGDVLQVLVRAGEYSQPGAGPLVVIGDLSELRVRMDVDERDVGRVAIGNAVTVRANAFPGADFSGKVVELGRRMGRKNVRTDDPTERNDTKILEVLIKLDNRDRLIVGQRVTCYVNGS